MQISIFKNKTIDVSFKGLVKPLFENGRCLTQRDASRLILCAVLYSILKGYFPGGLQQFK
jgi:hypothetical protein